MKFNLLFALFLFISTQSFADITNAGGSAGGGTHYGNQITHSVKVSPNDPKGSDENTIKGICEVVASATNLIPGPCVTLVLILNNPDGTEAGKARTSSQGAFTFESEKGKTYQIAVGSKLYNLVAPKGLVESGNHRVPVRIQQK
jgi:hypothetical protein